jgi:hypothetical protein
MMTGLTALAQTPREVNRKLADAERNSVDLYNGNRDSLVTIMNQTYKYLKATLPKVRGSLDFNYDSAGLFIKTATSADRKLRLWSINVSGGSYGYYGQLAEFRTPHDIRVLDFTDSESDLNPGGWFDTIYSVKSKSGKTFYLPVIHYHYDNRDLATGINAFTIDEDVLCRNVKLFRTPKKKLSSIEYAYDFFMSHGLSKIQFDRKSLFIPVVKGDSVTSSNLRYEFDGEEFVYKGVEK